MGFAWKYVQICVNRIKEKVNGHLKSIDLRNIFKTFYEEIKMQLIFLMIFYISHESGVIFFLKIVY